MSVQPDSFVFEKTMSDRHAVKINDEDVDQISAARRTSPCVTAVRNMGMTPRLYPPAAGDDVGAGKLIIDKNILVVAGNLIIGKNILVILAESLLVVNGKIFVNINLLVAGNIVVNRNLLVADGNVVAFSEATQAVGREATLLPSLASSISCCSRSCEVVHRRLQAGLCDRCLKSLLKVFIHAAQTTRRWHEEAPPEDIMIANGGGYRER